jgi:mycofactocin system creatininase family protein
MTWTEADAASASGAVTSPIVLVPVGSTEQHGPHLPLGTDTLIAEEIAGRALLHAPGGASDGLVLGPTLAVTASGEHAGFAGTLSIGTRVMAQVVVELVRSATWAEGVVFVNGHGGNYEPVERAVELLRSEQHRVLSWWPRWPRRTDGGPRDLHAGRIETSMMLAIDPGLVRLERARPGPSVSMEDLRTHGVRATSPSGVLGDPSGASGREGERLIRRFVDDLLFAIERWRPL